MQAFVPAWCLPDELARFPLLYPAGSYLQTGSAVWRRAADLLAAKTEDKCSALDLIHLCLLPNQAA